MTSAIISAVVQPDATAGYPQLVLKRIKICSSGGHCLLFSVVSEILFSETEVSATANPEIKKQPRINLFITILFR
ncbi:MAG: hypothetical protein ABJH01_17395 [Algoriphagus sp.]|uniref:hypothetical protein n=1 Tax=Algoriphagus sp. TaxID=1872435 RepID=UPI0032963D22